MRKAVTGFGVLLIGGILSCQALAADWEQMGEEFMSGASSNLYLGINNKTRTKYYAKDGEGKELDEYKTASETQGTVGVDFRSGYIGGVVGLDVSAVGRVDLGSRSPTGWSYYNYGMKVLKQTDCYYDTTGKYRCDDTSGTSGISEITIKARAGEGKNTLNFKTGLGYFDAGMIATSDEDDTSPTSYTGFELDGHIGNARIDYAWINGVIAPDDNSVQNIMPGSNYYSHGDYNQPENIEQLKIDFVHSVGVTRDIGGLKLILGAADAKEYLRRYMVRADYKLAFNKRENLLLRAQFYQNQNYGAVWDWQKSIDSKYENTPDRTQLINVSAAWTETLGKQTLWTLGLHHTRVGEGGFSYGLANVKGVLKNDTGGNYDSMRGSNQQSWAVENTLDFKQSRNQWLKGLLLTYGYHFGKSKAKDKTTGEYTGNNDYEDEHAITGRYIIHKGTMKGLSFNLKQSFYNNRSNEEGRINQTKFDIAYTIPLM